MTSERNLQVGLVLTGGMGGLAYGLLLRYLIFSKTLSMVLPIMSVAFLMLGPFAIGMFSVWLIERSRPLHIVYWIFFPWAPVIAGVLLSIAALWEGFICAIMFAPIGMVFASGGGVLGGLVGKHQRLNSSRSIVAACILFFPLIVGPWEHRIFLRNEVREIQTLVDIQAPPLTVWQNIERVPPIRAAELPPSWARSIGFPAPIEATLSYQGVGGVRHATFAGGILFVEKVDVWEPEHRLAFSIHAQTAQIPPTTLDQHVTVGGPFFDVLRGEYRLEGLRDGTTRLHLSSQERVSTDFDWYAHLWTDAVMRDLQTSILEVIRQRCEDTAHAAGGNHVAR
jgi:hypothetical protein